MAATSTPYGAQMVSDQSGIGRTVRMQNGIQNGLASNIFKFQPIKMVTAGGGQGTVAPVTNAGGVPDPIWGIFAGVEYTPQGGRPAVSPYWPSGTTYDTTLDMFVYFWPLWLPNLRIRVQADGSVGQTLLGSSFNFTNLGNGSTATGLSACTVAAAGVAAGSQGQLTLTEFDNQVGDTIGDAFTDLICTIAYPQVGMRIASIG